MAETELTGAQVRMARAFLRWSLADVAENAGIGISTVQRIEGDAPLVGGGGSRLDQWREQARDEALGKLAKALTRAGVTLLPDNGEGAGIRGKVKKAR